MYLDPTLLMRIQDGSNKEQRWPMSYPLCVYVPCHVGWQHEESVIVTVMFERTADEFHLFWENLPVADGCSSVC
jgi:hypothetical protein